MLQLAREYDDPWYIAYQDESSQWLSENMALREMVANLGVELASKNQLIYDLKRVVEEEKKNSELVRKEKWALETDLAVIDQVVEDLKQENATAKGGEKTRYMVAVITVVISVLAVLLSRKW